MPFIQSPCGKSPSCLRSHRKKNTWNCRSERGNRDLKVPIACKANHRILRSGLVYPSIRMVLGLVAKPFLLE